MKNKILNIGLALLAMVFVVACSDDDFTGDSTMSATSPNLTVDLGFSNTETLVEDGSSYDFTVNLSEPQIANVVVYLTQTGGDATEGADFTFPHTVTIPAGSTSASGTITILEDDLIEENESVVITIGTGKEANVASVSSETVTFNIGNLEKGELMANLSWEASETTTTNSGEVIGATDLADLRLLVTDVPYTEILEKEDGAGFESITLDADTPDGKYYLVADFYAAMDISRDLDLTLKFDQPGVINGDTYTFPMALTTSQSCEAAHFVMVQIEKSGDIYTITEIAKDSPLKSLSDLVGSWTGETSYGHETQVVTSLNEDGKLVITGIGVGFMEEDWGEVIIDQQSLIMDVNLETGEFTITESYYMRTTYDADDGEGPQVQDDYYLVASGKFSGVCTPQLDINYDFIQDGTSYTEWLTEGNGYPPFEEIGLTLE